MKKIKKFDFQKLNSAQSSWVDKIFISLTTEEKIAQLICPASGDLADVSAIKKWKQIIGKIPIGGIFIDKNKSERILKFTQAIQHESNVPIIVASDLENGPGTMIEGCIEFPYLMACGAADDEDLAYKMGEVTALVGRAHGIHWSFGPVVDLNLNFRNSVINVRSLGENPQKVRRLATSIIKGMQDNGMVATAKHFPGDGVDDRDQHLCTSVNSLTRDEWFNTYGRVWRSVFDVGVLSVMVGHIALPFMDSDSLDPYGPMPATLSYKIQVELLRKELRFRGLVISDAQGMGGISSRLTPKERIIQNILTGSDMALFAEPERDFKFLYNAVKEGRLSEKRIDESVRRILKLKAWFGLHESRKPIQMPSKKQQCEWAKNPLEMARKSVTVVRNFGNKIPLKIKAGTNVLTVTLTYGNKHELDLIDSILTAHQFHVTHLRNPKSAVLAEEMRNADVVLINCVVITDLLWGIVNLVGYEVKGALWNSLWKEHPYVIFSSFGNPYHLYEIPAAPNWINVYSPGRVSQRAFVEVLLGERKATGKGPEEAAKSMATRIDKLINAEFKQ